MPHRVVGGGRRGRSRRAARRATIDHLLRHGNIYHRRDDGTIIRVHDTRTLYSHARVSVYATVRTVLTRQRPEDDLLSLAKPPRYMRFSIIIISRLSCSTPSISSPHSTLLLSVPISHTQCFPTSNPLCMCACVRVRCVSLSLQNRPLFPCRKSTLGRALPIRII